ncbi:flagellar hook-basal body protein [Pelotalea chapellei]|uniref:Flagellar hook protein FlgE n=1 Tax=Pelotalea chapellei TaxID=44671 RepID=A0ABS5U8E3_9BACT|nr:flagellar hook basal-body protein [Pelotalea chapellei]MBT1071943.1 flagellar hook basal-body protein [Pelotalea chapellei]
MSITSAMFTGVSGLLANAEGINVIGNNLSNVNTIGFKSGRMLFSDMLSANIGNGSQIGRGTQIQKVDNLFSQSSFETTEIVTDLAIQGNSFFAVKDPNAAAPVNQNGAMLTRAGAFRLDSNLNLVNPDGFQVLDTAGNPIKFLDDGNPANNATNFSKITNIDSSGLITYLAKDGITTNYYNTTGAVGVAANAANAATVQRLAVVTVTNPGGLDKAGGTLFRPTTASGIPAAAFTLAGNSANGSSEKIYTNSLEQSNVDMAAQFVKMILTQRAYSANSKTITTADEMTQEVLNLKR